MVVFALKAVFTLKAVFALTAVIALKAVFSVVEAAGFAVDTDIDDAYVVCSSLALPTSHAGTHFGHGAGARQYPHKLM